MKTLYFYGETSPKTKKQKSRRVTVAGILNDDKQVIRLGIAACSHKDQFIKSKGRAIATGRANSSHPFNIVKMEKESVKQFVDYAKQIINQL